jgi:hypothetical protein
VESVTWPGRHFTQAELMCRCGRTACDAPTIPEPGLVTLLDDLRDTVGGPLVVTSGLRCAAHNAALGGDPTSGHLTGTEADLACPTSRARYRLLTAAFARGVPRVGIYQKHIHIGLRSALPQDVCWWG